MTHRELIQKAMPLESLTDNDWDLVVRNLDKQEGKIQAVFQKMLQNQARIEMMSNYLDYFGDRLAENLPKDSLEIHIQ